jgi:N4-gp56 family major capsid protein
MSRARTLEELNQKIDRILQELQVAGMLDTTEIIKPTELIAKQVEAIARQRATARQLVRVNRDLVGAPGNTLKLPRRTADVSAVDVVEGAAITKSQVGYDTVSITPTKKGTGVEITYEAIEQSFVDLINDEIDSAGYALAKKEDDDIYNVLGGTTRTLAAKVPGVLSYDDVVDAVSRLRADNWDPDTLVIHSEQLGDLLKDTKFINASAYGGREPLLNGEIGRFAGVRVIVTNSVPTNFPATTALVLDSKRAAVHAIKRDITVRRRENPATDSVEIYFTMMYATGRVWADANGPIIKITGA